jgi:hypothetical protein
VLNNPWYATRPYSKFNERLKTALSAHNLTISTLFHLPEFSTLESAQQDAIISSFHAAIGDDPGLLRAWVVALSCNHSKLNPTHLLFILTDIAASKAEEEAKAARAADVTRFQEQLAEAKTEAEKVLAEAVARARAPSCAVCLEGTANYMPFECQHVSVCAGMIPTCMS